MVIKYRKDNNLTVLLEPLMAWSRSQWDYGSTGVRDRKPEQYGYAHFVEHMLWGQKEIFSKRYSPHCRTGSAATMHHKRNYTCYYINVVSTTSKMSLDILSNMYYNSLFDAERSGKEKNVIIEDQDVRDTPMSFAT